MISLLCSLNVVAYVSFIWDCQYCIGCLELESDYLHFYSEQIHFNLNQWSRMLHCIYADLELGISHMQFSVGHAFNGIFNKVCGLVDSTKL